MLESAVDYVEDRHGSVRNAVVRLIKPEEREQWDELIRRHHYLRSERMPGETLRYVALLEGRWVALLGWSSAALKCQPRDSWIGWSPSLRYQRLVFLANNARFLILPGVDMHNLASRVLALTLRRLCSDWQAVHGHGVLMVETFVDAGRFQGTCYKAAGWLALGRTKGFAKHSHHYIHHGQPKIVLVRPLHRRALEWLRDPTPRADLGRKVAPMKFSRKQVDDLMDCLYGIRDPRKRRGIRHGKVSILAISICAVLSGARGFAAVAEWAKRCSQPMLKRFNCRMNPHTRLYQPPSEPAIRRLLHTIDAQAVDDALDGWIRRVASPASQAVGIDGKTLRGARQPDGTKVHLLSAFVHQQGITIAQRQVPCKSNEIPSAKPLLEPLELEGKTITADSLHTQKELATFVVKKKKADYCFTVKDNQPQLKEDIALLFQGEAFPPSVPERR